MPTLYLVRHGRPLVDSSRPSREWRLDPAYTDDVRGLRGRLPVDALWYTSPEPKAVGTTTLLTDAPVEVVEDLRELVRDSTDWIEDFEAAVERCFSDPDRSACDGWEPLTHCRRRVTLAVRALMAGRPGRDLVLVGHGTARTALAADLRGEEPDLDRWRRLSMPDLLEVVVPGPAGR